MGRERERVCVCVCVCDAKGLCASRSKDAEAGRGDADRDGPSWLQQHGWRIRNGITGDLRGTRAERGGKSDMIRCRLWAKQRWLYTRTLCARRCSKTKGEGTYKGSPQRHYTRCNASPVVPSRDPICEVLCTSRVTWVDSYRGDVHVWSRPATVGGSRCVGTRRRATKGSLRVKSEASKARRAKAERAKADAWRARVQASRGRRWVIPRLPHDMRLHQKLR